MQADPADRVELLKAAYRKIADLRIRLAEAARQPNEPVAIVSMACRMPGGVDDPDAFWQLLVDGVDGTSDIPPERWDADEYYDADPDAPNKMYVRRGGFVGNFRGFDPRFFHVSRVEAVSMDPQQRLLLEVTWEALENAGWAPDQLKGTKTGVFIGTSGSDFSHMIVKAFEQSGPQAHMATGLSASITAGHLSYFLGLRGPCMALDTACSSALTAIHAACDSLRKGESTSAIAGAVNLVLSPLGNLLVCKARMLAPDGHCKTFDVSADGYARSDGCGVVVLKLLSQAQADGDQILGVIRGSACNQDGRTNGITAPNGNAQREVIEAALAAARVTPAEIGYVETHGTGTSLGDPIEVQALSEVFSPNRAAASKVVLGAVKSNIGHLECAAGIAAIIKTVLVLQKGEIPPNLHFKNPNPQIPWNRLPFAVPTERMLWKSNCETRKAGVSAFGFSGTNVHIVLEQPPTPEPRQAVQDRYHYLLVLSALTLKALTDLAARYITFFEHTPGVDLGDVCFTAATGRAHFTHRLAIDGANIEEMRSKLIDFVAEPRQHVRWTMGTASNRAPGVGLFIGDCSPAPGVAAQGSTPYQDAMRVCNVAASATGISLAGNADASGFAHAFASGSQWLDWGIVPVAMSAIGKSLLAAAALSGSISVEDALRLLVEPNAVVRISPAELPLLSPETGQVLTADGLRKLLTIDQLLAQDRLWAGMAREGGRITLALGTSKLIETGAHRLITANVSSWTEMLGAIGCIYTAGVDFAWGRFEAPWPRRRMTLPTYPFQREDCWFESPSVSIKSAGPAAAPLHPLLEHRLHAAALNNDLVFESTFGAGRPTLLDDHKFYSTIIVSMTTMLEMALAGGRIALGAEPHVQDVEVEQPLLISTDHTRLVHTIFTPNGAGFSFSILSADSQELDNQPVWDRHCTGNVSRLVTSNKPAIDLSAILGENCRSVEPSWFYETLAKSGVDYGPSFQALETIRCDRNITMAKLVLPPDQTVSAAAFGMHPGLLDAAIQAFGLAGPVEQIGNFKPGTTFMPVGVESYMLTRPTGSEIWCHAVVRPFADGHVESFTGDARLFDMTGAPIGELSGVLFKRNSRRKLAREIYERKFHSWLYQPQWHLLPTPAPATVKMGERWLLLGADNPVAAPLTQRLSDAGASLIVVQRSTYDTMLQDAVAGGKLDGIVYLALGKEDADNIDLAKELPLDLLDLIQALQRNGIFELSNLSLVTRGFKSPSIGDTGTLAGGSVWGFGRVVAGELPELNCRMYDLDATLTVDEVVERLAAELIERSAENQIALDRTGRFALRLLPADGQYAESHKFGIGAVRLDMGGRGDFSRLRFVPQIVPPPGPNEVQLRVLATAMNFRDVLNVLDMYPGNPGNPGVECVGEVVGLGADVEGIALGDHVIAIPYEGYCTFANAPLNMVFKRPEHLSVAECATLLVAYLTATYALNHLARMQSGERVLIHAGAGGVGLAAVQLAQRAGAEVYATAGSPAKRDYLRRIGADHVFDSRSIDFVEQIKAVTRGEGVDLVLNSLTGQAMEQSLRLLRAGGRFMEIGKTDVYDAAQARAINPDAVHEVIDLLAPFQDNAEMMQALFADICKGLASGKLRPLPYKLFGLDEVTQAFRYMASARHVGKIVVVDRSVPEYRAIEPTGAYMITGGLGGLGLACARLLAEDGAKSIVLVSRRAPGAQEQISIAAIEAAGATVHVAQADVGDRQQLLELLATYFPPAQPLRGIIHSAGLIDDGMITGQDHERFGNVLQPKVDGGWFLHELTLKSPLEFFVLFSSGAGLFGNSGQSSYAAASVFLDELACARQNGGLPGLSIDWGPWSEVGMAARMDGRHSQDWAAQGLGTIAPDDGLTVLRMLMRMGRFDQVAVLPFKPGGLARSVSEVPPFLCAMVSAPVKMATTPIDAPKDSHAARFHEADAHQKPAILVVILTDIVIELFRLDPAHGLSSDQNLTEIGMDSLMAIQLRNRLKSAFSVAMPATIVFQRPTIFEIADYILEQLPTVAENADKDEVRDGFEPRSTARSAESLLANLGDMNDDDVEALLAKMEKIDDSR